MPAIVITSQERNVFHSDAATADQLQQALTSAASQFQSMPRPADAPPNADSGGWVGPAPRIVRWHDLSLTNPPDVTNVAWVYSWSTDDPKWNRYVTQTMQSLVTQNLLAISNGRSPHDGNFTTATAQSFDPAINGSLNWWADGTAANTQTRYVLPPFSMGSVTDPLTWTDVTPRDNPVGPGVLTTLANAPSRGPSVPDVTKLLEVVAWLAAGGIVVYLTWPLLMGLRSGASVASHALPAETAPTAALSNPTRGRQRRRSSTRYSRKR